MKEAPGALTGGRLRRQPARAGAPSAHSLGWPITLGTALLVPGGPPTHSFLQPFLQQACIEHLLCVCWVCYYIHYLESFPQS